MKERDKEAAGNPQSEEKRDPKFSLNRETVADLGVDEAQSEDDEKGSTFSCCVGCNTDGSASFCAGKTGC